MTENGRQYKAWLGPVLAAVLTVFFGLVQLAARAELNLLQQRNVALEERLEHQSDVLEKRLEDQRNGFIQRVESLQRLAEARMTSFESSVQGAENMIISMIGSHAHKYASEVALAAVSNRLERLEGRQMGDTTR